MSVHHDSRRRKAAVDYLRAEEAASWVQILRDPTPEQRALFVVWLKSLPQNVEDFLVMVSLDDALNGIDPHKAEDLVSLMAQVNPQVVPFPRRLAPARATPPAGRAARQRRPWRRAGLAAAVTLAVAAWLITVSRGPGSQELRTGVGEQRSFELSDGSIVQLNARSRATVHLSDNLRQVRLQEGEALFRVHHERGRPFQVVTDDATVQDQGTQFDVYARPESTRIAVLEGRVSIVPTASPPGPGLTDGRTPPVHRAGQPVSLGADEEASVDHTGSVIRSKEPVADAVAWRQRRLVFRQESLARIAEEFNRYNRRQLVVEGTAATHLYTGVFDADDPEALADVLARDLNLSVHRTDQRLVVKAQ